VSKHRPPDGAALLEKTMKKGTALALAASIGLAVPFASSAAEPKGGAPAKGSANVERGRYLVTLGGCNDCHSPKVFTPKGPQVDESKRLSGHPASEKLPTLPAGVLGPDRWGAVTTNGLTAWTGPWGTTFAANLTPDATGLGNWTPEAFIKTMRTGKHLGEGRQILPPMPWADIGHLTDADLRAMFAYLKSLRPVANEVPPPLPPAGGK
jgi:mono/diheme cytochrome c family protein